jgi:aryl-alcohol dehydrogenase-like predicted oxidoreductase
MSSRHQAIALAAAVHGGYPPAMHERTISNSDTAAPASFVVPVADPTHREPSALPRASAAGTARYAARYAERFQQGFYRTATDELTVASVGIGTYLGDHSAAEDQGYAETIRAALAGGVNLVDTAINYRCQRSERVVGRVLRQALASGELARDEVVLCTKGGFVPLDGDPPATKEGYQGYLQREFFSRRVMKPADVVAGGHCLAPRFIAHQLDRSRANLGVEAIDVYYVHNPEQQLAAVSYPELLERLRAVFTLLEERVDAGEIGSYGVASWTAFRTSPDHRGHVALADLVRIAREVGGEGHHFRVVQMPVSLAMQEAVRLPTQPLDALLVPALDAARALGLGVVASAPLAQGRLTRDLPPQVAELFADCTSDAQRAVAFVRSLPGVTAALVGMRQRGHLEDNLAGIRP